MSQKALKEYLETGKKPEAVATQDEGIITLPIGFAQVSSASVGNTQSDKILKILSRLVGIEMIAKDLHYRAGGKTFYAIHLLADLVWDVRRERDELNEVYYLGERNTVPPTSGFVFNEAVRVVANLYGSKLPTEKDITICLNACCHDVALLVEEVKKNGSEPISSGTGAILDEISKKMLASEGLLSRTLQEEMTTADGE